MEVKAKNTEVTIEITGDPMEFFELDREFNVVYERLGKDVDRVPAIWELKDKINMAIGGGE